MELEEDVEDRNRRKQLLEWKEITCRWLRELGTPTLLPILRLLDALDMPVFLWMVSHEWKTRALQYFRQVSSYSNREQLQCIKTISGETSTLGAIQYSQLYQ